MLVAGSRNKAGAAVLAARAALRTGIGLITCHAPGSCCSVIQAAVPESMVRLDENDTMITSVTGTGIFSAVGAGPGIGTSEKTSEAIKRLLTGCSEPIVLDADAINILGSHKEFLSLIKPGTVLTPHLKEFERIAGEAGSGYERLMRQISFSEKYKCVVVLKGAHTSVTLPDGNVFFNSTGNPGMAKGGSGDVLTGIILSLLSQGYKAPEAAIIGVFLHGMAGDIAVRTISPESVIATDITENISTAFFELKKKRSI